MRLHQLPDDGQAHAAAAAPVGAQTQCLPPPAVEGLEDPAGVGRVHARPLVDAIERGHAGAGIVRDAQDDASALGTEADGVGKQIADDGPQLLGIGGNFDVLALDAHLDAARLPLQPLRLGRPGGERAQAKRRALQAARVEGRGVVLQQTLDLFLQGERVLAQDLRDFARAGAERAGDAVEQQRGAFAQRGQRRLEFVRDMPQKLLLVRFERGQAPAQPVDAPAQLAQVGGAADADFRVEPAGAQTLDGRAQPPQRQREQHAEDQREQRRQRDGERAEPTERAALRLELVEQHGVAPVDIALELAVEKAVEFAQAAEGGEHHDAVHLAGHRGAGHGAAGRGALREPFVEQGLQAAGQQAARAQAHLLRLHPVGGEIAAQGRIVEHQVLARGALQRHRMLAEPALALDERHRAQRMLAVRVGERLDRDQRAHQRAAEQQRDAEKADEQQLAEGEAWAQIAQARGASTQAASLAVSLATFQAISWASSQAGSQAAHPSAQGLRGGAAPFSRHAAGRRRRRLRARP
ncbi:MAG: hypothetical protein MO847_03845 [Candidatus Protistobacter heckmanni]|nr:hypothetical protein [Candidatus Protistobacter heckmanni]